MNTHRLSRNYHVRKALYFLLAPVVGVGEYIINSQTNSARSLDGIKLTSLNAVQVKNFAIESKSDVTGLSNGVFSSDNNGPKPSGA